MMVSYFLPGIFHTQRMAADMIRMQLMLSKYLPDAVIGIRFLFLIPNI